MRHITLALLLTACGTGKSTDDTGSTGETGGAYGNGIEPAEPVVPDCTWFSEDNCWKSAVRAVEECLPTGSSSGSFAPNFQSCDFSSGGRLNLSSDTSFASPFDWSSLSLRGFQLTDDTGSTCVSYLGESKSNSTSWSVDTPEGNVTYTVPDLLSVGGLLTCPDGVVYDLGEEVMACPDANANWPFISHAATGSSLTFGLQGGDDPVTLFTCSG